MFTDGDTKTRLGWLTTTPLPKTETKKREKDKETEESAIFETETQIEKLLHLRMSLYHRRRLIYVTKLLINDDDT